MGEFRELQGSDVGLESGSVEGTTPKLKAKPTPVVKDRITVVETIYYQPFGDQATSVESKFDRILDSVDEQPYSRKCKATEEWQSLDTGWVKTCSMLSIENNEGKFAQRIPTPEERDEAKAKVLELAYSGEYVDEDTWLILPGESMRGLPADLSRLLIRCRKGSAKFTVTAFPA